MTQTKGKEKKKNKDRKQVKIDDHMITWRIDRALARQLPQWSRTGIGDLIRSGGVFLNGVVVKKGSQTLKHEDVIEIDENIYGRVEEGRETARKAEQFSDTGSVSAVVPEDIPLEIVYEDEDVLVVDKPAGIVVHPAYANPQGTLANAIAGYFTRKGIPLIRRIGLVHRLDKDVSGLIAVAKNRFAHSALSQQFSGEGVGPDRAEIALKARKVYWVVVEPQSTSILKKSGLSVPGKEIKVEGYIGRSKKNRKISIFSKGTVYGRVHKERYALSYMKQVRAVGKNKYLLEVRIVTGRTHQIRSQLKSMDIPIVGDTMYGGSKRRKKGIALRCVELSFIPPRVYEDEKLKIRKLRGRIEKSPVKGYFKKALRVNVKRRIVP